MHNHNHHSTVQWVVRIVERCWSLVNPCLLTFQRWERDLGIPRRSWLTGGNPPCGWARATSQTSIRSEPTKELVEKSRSVRRLAEHSWSEENLRANVEAPQKPKSTTLDIPPAADPLAPLPAAPGLHEDEKEEPTEKPAQTKEMQGSHQTQR